MAKYAADTKVSTSQSRDEIERTLSRYGATAFAFATAADQAMIGFEAHGRRIQFRLPLPSRNAREFTHTPEKELRRSQEDALKAWEQSCRQRWRALALAIKAKLEAVEAGITTFEDEFLAHTVLPGGRTVSEFVQAKISLAYETGEVPLLMPPTKGN